jgi:hypothetical protein
VRINTTSQHDDTHTISLSNNSASNPYQNNTLNRSTLTRHSNNTLIRTKNNSLPPVYRTLDHPNNDTHATHYYYTKNNQPLGVNNNNNNNKIDSCNSSATVVNSNNNNNSSGIASANSTVLSSEESSSNNEEYLVENRNGPQKIKYNAKANIFLPNGGASVKKTPRRNPSSQTDSLRKNQEYKKIANAEDFDEDETGFEDCGYNSNEFSVINNSLAVKDHSPLLSEDFKKISHCYNWLNKQVVTREDMIDGLKKGEDSTSDSDNLDNESQGPLPFPTGHFNLKTETIQHQLNSCSSLTLVSKPPHHTSNSINDLMVQTSVNAISADLTTKVIYNEARSMSLTNGNSNNITPPSTFSASASSTSSGCSSLENNNTYSKSNSVRVNETLTVKHAGSQFSTYKPILKATSTNSNTNNNSSSIKSNTSTFRPSNKIDFV